MLHRLLSALAAGLLLVLGILGSASAEESQRSSLDKLADGSYQASASTNEDAVGSRADGSGEPGPVKRRSASAGAVDRGEDPVAKWEREVALTIATDIMADVVYAACMAGESSTCEEPKYAERPDPLRLSTSTDEPAPAAPVRTRITPGEAGAKAVARLQLPTLKAQIGPDPAKNEWGMIPVGYPVWLFADGETSLSDSDEVEDLAVSLEAELTSMTFDMGDGTTVTCDGPGTKHTADVEPGTSSPTCGHTYQQVPRGSAKSYTVTATAHWSITWTALGESATVTDTTSSTTELPVGELQVVVTE